MLSQSQPFEYGSSNNKINNLPEIGESGGTIHVDKDAKNDGLGTAGIETLNDGGEYPDVEVLGVYHEGDEQFVEAPVNHHTPISDISEEIKNNILQALEQAGVANDLTKFYAFMKMYNKFIQSGLENINNMNALALEQFAQCIEEKSSLKNRNIALNVKVTKLQEAFCELVKNNEKLQHIVAGIYTRSSIMGTSVRLSSEAKILFLELQQVGSDGKSRLDNLLEEYDDYTFKNLMDKS